jgi:hypothetical protein
MRTSGINVTIELDGVQVSLRFRPIINDPFHLILFGQAQPRTAEKAVAQPAPLSSRSSLLSLSSLFNKHASSHLPHLTTSDETAKIAPIHNIAKERLKYVEVVQDLASLVP